ncbi:MAG: DUF5615 family PIN-like protein [Verrucomicrobiae bacterium]|nr:DUF5615 family PIN-like protein [Verrucomicrobiae bacterium]MDW8310126.1 DUF5615 family PIN-like protein [Verrucomicrobiales bacterium]
MKVSVDACLPVEWVDYLRRHGHECVGWLEIGSARAPDSVVMSWARERGFIVLTNDLVLGSFWRSPVPHIRA